jgi:hypothetical protein
MKKGKQLILAALSLIGMGGELRAATPQSSVDLWDQSQGSIVTAASGTLGESGGYGMFGGGGYGAEPGTTIFGGVGVGGTNYIEWRTPTIVTVTEVRLFTRGDSDTDYREWAKFTLKAKSPGSPTFDVTVFSSTPSHPMPKLDPASWLVLNQAVSVTAQEFRAEFVQLNDGPRVMELDGIGFAVPLPPSIVSQPATNLTVAQGAFAQLSATVAGSNPLSFQWQREGTNVVLSSRVAILNGNLAFNPALIEDTGAYKLIVTNAFGSVESAVANLTVVADETSPVVTITSPTAGNVGTPITLAGTISDNGAIASASWEKDGVAMGPISLFDGQFAIPAINLNFGTNVLKVIAADAAGNVGFAEITLLSSVIVHATDDLFDLSRGTIVTGTSGFYSAEPSPGMLGGAGTVEVENTVFRDRSLGFIHTIDWRTAASVTVTNVKVFSRGDSGGTYREFASLTLKAKSIGSTNYDITVFSHTPNAHPWPLLDPNSFMMLDTNVTAVTAQEFRAEVVQLNGGPRVMEVDAFGPATSGPPTFLAQPQSRTNFVGSSATLSATVGGKSPMSYQWRRAGTNLDSSPRIQGARTSLLSIENLTLDDAGEYTLAATNSLGGVVSDVAVLTVAVDTNAPVISIDSPTTNSQPDQVFILSGTLEENDRVVALRWQRNGVEMGSVNYNGNSFFQPNLLFVPGTNEITVIATDASGNIGTNTIATTFTPPRALLLGASPVQQEGGRFSVPVTLVTTGGVAAATFMVGFDTNLVADPRFEWVDEIGLGLTSVNLETPRRYRASFAQAGGEVASGARTIANISFRARSVPTNRVTSITMDLIGFYAATGDEFTNGNVVSGTSATITKRKITGDNNANDRLDIGDASIILRFLTRFDLPRSWDVTGNDLNKNFNVDSGDVIRVLRAVVGIDPQPIVPTSPALAPLLLPAGGNVQLVASKGSAAAGEQVVVEARIVDQTAPVLGASFRLVYPSASLRLDDYELGSMVSKKGLALWNVQPGSISLAAMDSSNWDSASGTVARFTFTTLGTGAEVDLRSVEITSNGYETANLGGDSVTLVAPARFGSTITFNSSLAPQLTLIGQPGSSYVVEASSDLVEWTAVGTFTSNAEGAVQVDDSAGAGAPVRFYKATLVP